jgi:hypothetical protein
MSGGEGERKIGVGRGESRLAEDGEREFVDVFVGYVPEVGNEGGTTRGSESVKRSGREGRGRGVPASDHVMVRSSNGVEVALLLQHAGRAAPEHRNGATREVTDRL